MASPMLALSLTLFSATASVPPPSLMGPPASSHAEGEYEAALAAVERANLAVNNDPEANLDELAAAIEQLSDFGLDIAASPAGRETLDLSLLNLARALLLTDDETQAAAVMDEVIRSAHGQALPIARFGPTLVAFHDRRLAALEARGTATIQVQCQVSCEVVIDARPSTTDSGPLYLGYHRVWVRATDDSSPPARHDVELDESGSTAVVHFGPDGPPSCDDVAAPTPTPSSTAPAPSKRILPRWAEISVAVIGLGAVVAGGVMLGLDGKCPGGFDPISDAPRCPELYEGTVPGLVALGLGSVFVVAGGVTLSIDEVRINNQRGRQATLAWQLRF